MTGDPRSITASVGAFAGTHVLAELSGVDARLLDDAAYLREALDRALTEAGATVHELVARHFEPQGATVLAMLAESHASIHTYPEFGTAFVDVFTCGERADPERAVHLLAAALGTGETTMSTVRRGRAPARTGSHGG